MDKPNVVLLTIDTLRYDRLGCNGYQRPLTPNLDRLAEKGVRFTQAITGGSWTQAAFPVMMTSTYASMYGGCLGALAPERPSPITTLVENGYTTGGFSTSPLLSHTYGYDRGFHYFTDLTPNETDPRLRNIRGGQRLLRSPLTHKVSGLLGQRTRPAKLYVTAEELTADACRWLDTVDGPFFAWVHYMDVHWPYHQEERLAKPADIAQAWRDLSHLHEVNFNGATITTEQRAHYIRLYEEALAYTDAQVGKLLDYLEENGLAENTIIVAVSDHGEEFMDHGRWGHWENNLYDEILHIPFLIKVPGLEENKVVTRQVRTLDLMPTLLDLCDCPFPAGMLGESMVPLWTGREDEYEAAVSVSEMWREHWHIIAVRTEQFKYLWDSLKPDRPILYNLSSDPGETQDVSGQYPEQVAKLNAYVEERRRQMQDTQPEHALAGPALDDEVLDRLRGLGYLE